ncbi:hypothetical protein A3958_09625 [Paenibacillus glucanolyticus]|nr:hypothetical protein A3958_09625 [Paenibacillus glucanolyticus]
MPKNYNRKEALSKTAKARAAADYATVCLLRKSIVYPIILSLQGICQKTKLRMGFERFPAMIAGYPNHNFSVKIIRYYILAFLRGQGIKTKTCFGYMIGIDAALKRSTVSTNIGYRHHMPPEGRIYLQYARTFLV